MTTRFTFYCHTNKVNGKRYVGQTVGTMEERWKGHVSAARQGVGSRVFGAAIRKYGPEAFDHEVLEVVETTQQEADIIETEWIKRRQSRVPSGYNLMVGGGGLGHHHEDSKRLIGEASRSSWTAERKVRARERERTQEERDRVAAGQKDFWSKFTPEEKFARVQHQMAGMSAEQKSDRVRKVWASMTSEARKARVLKTRAASAWADSVRSERLSAWQTEQARLRTPEQRSEMVKKAWTTRRAKYGQDGVARAKTAAEYSESTKRGWATMTPEARAERVRKVQEGRRRAKEARLAARRPSLLFNLLAPRAA